MKCELYSFRFFFVIITVQVMRRSAPAQPMLAVEALEEKEAEVEVAVAAPRADMAPRLVEAQPRMTHRRGGLRF